MSSRRSNKSRKGGSKQRQLTSEELQSLRTNKVVELLSPSVIGTVGNIGVNVRDITPFLRSQLLQFNTSGNKVHSVRSPCTTLNTFAQTATNDTFGVLVFTGASINNFSDYAAVFDQYRVLAFEVRFSPRYTAQQYNATDINPRLYTVIDYDDAIVPSSRTTFLSYETLIITPPGQGIVRVFQPHCSPALEVTGGGNIAAGNNPSPWIDMAVSYVSLFGMKLCCDAGSASQTNLQVWDIDAVAYVQFKNVR